MRPANATGGHGNTEIGDPALVNDIFERQLQVSDDEFWLAVHLAVHVGLSDLESAALTAQEAMDAWLDWCRQQGPA